MTPAALVTIVRALRDGAVAQLGERLVRNEEVRGSIPLSSTGPARLRKVALSVQADAIHVIGAAGRSGLALCRSLLGDGWTVKPLVRNALKWAAAGLPSPPRVADVGDGTALRAALADATVVVSCVHARHAGVILAAAPAAARFVFLGSTRRFTRWPDAHGAGVIAGDLAFLASGRSGVMLHPTMIYGAEGEDNVQRLAALLRRVRVLPLPGGGRALVQPIHQDDVTRAMRAAIRVTWNAPESLVIAGPEPLPYAHFARAVARAAGLPPLRIVPVPGRLLIAAAPLVARLGRMPHIRPEEIRRLLEDKAFDIGPMRARLGVDPMTLAHGLALTFAPPHTERAAEIVAVPIINRIADLYDQTRPNTAPRIAEPPRSSRTMRIVHDGE